jgi:hypothetical protein
MVVRCAAPLQQRFWFQKIFCASERLVRLTLHHLQKPAEVFQMLLWHSYRVKKKDGVLLRVVSVHPFPRQDSPTCPDTSSTYSTLRQCKAMPLQVGMGKGPRSKAVCVSGLQYSVFILLLLFVTTTISFHYA